MHPVLSATLKAPLLNVPISPVLLLVPSGNMTREPPSLILFSLSLIAYTTPWADLRPIFIHSRLLSIPWTSGTLNNSAFAIMEGNLFRPK